MKYKTSFSEPAKGVTLCSIDTGSRFKLSNITVNFVLPLSGDVASSAVLPYILKRTCKKYSTTILMSRRLAELYGATLSAGVSKIGENQQITLSAGFLDDRFSLDGESISSETADLLLDVIFEPNIVNGAFGDEDVEREKRLMIERKESEMNEKRVYAMKRCIKHMFEGEAYATDEYGEIEDIKAIDSSSLIKAWKRLLRGAKIMVTTSGHVDETLLYEKLEQRFAGIEREVCELHTEFITTASETRKVHEEIAAKQGKLVIGMRAGMTYNEDNIYAIRVMCDLFGGGVYSKLFKNVREKMSLCYYCSASFNRNKGFIMVQSGIENENAEKATEAIIAQLDDVRNGNFSNEDLEASHKGLGGSIMSIPDSADYLNSWYASQILDSSFISPEEYAKKIRAVTREEIITAACFVSLDTVYMLEGTSPEDKANEA